MNKSPPVHIERVEYPFPTSYRIGAKTTEALVEVDDLKRHLRLLRIFHDLRSLVEDGEDSRLPQMARNLDRSQRWAWFLHLAVERFQRWIEAYGKVPDPGTSILDFMNYGPPVDVVMVWHAYLLNPGWFAEDSIRIPALRHITRFYLALIPIVEACGEDWMFRPSAVAAQFWLRGVGTPFDPLSALSHLAYRQTECPHCYAMVSTPFLTKSGHGYAQRDFRILCTACGFLITKERLAVAKMSKDLVKNHRTARVLGHDEETCFLAGTLYSPTSMSNATRAALIKDFILVRSATFKSMDLDDQTVEDPERRIQETVSYSLEGIRKAAAEGMVNGGGKLLNRIMSAYFDDRPFSIELVGAVLRQGSFVNKMNDLGWTNPLYFDSAQDAVALQHAVARYHAFLDLMATSPTEFFVPTLDIDLAWHTHQLNPDFYSQDCLKYVRRYVDHDDKVEEHHLSLKFDLTCRAWKSRYGVPYMHCGCPLPGDTIGQRLNGLKRNTFSKLTPSCGSPDHLDPPIIDESTLAATHPSDHNAVYVSSVSSSEKHRKQRQEKFKKRRERDKQNMAKGKLDDATFRRGDAHYVAFLVPVPMFMATEATAQCVSASGGVVDSAGCAVGASGCGSAATCAAGGMSGGCGGGAGGGVVSGSGGCAGGAGGGGCGGGGGGGCGGGGGGGGVGMC